MADKIDEVHDQFSERREKLNERRAQFVRAMSNFYLMRCQLKTANDGTTFTEDTYPDIFGTVAYNITQAEERLSSDIKNHTREKYGS